MKTELDIKIWYLIMLFGARVWTSSIYCKLVNQQTHRNINFKYEIENKIDSMTLSKFIFCHVQGN